MADNFIFQDLKPKLVDFRSEVIRGLSSERKKIAPKFFYDNAGSKIFERITELEEYYLTRSEMSILRKNGVAIRTILEKGACLIEFGGGNLSKGRVFLDLISPEIYVPIDISKDFLCTSAIMLAEERPDLTVWAVCSDFMKTVAVPGLPSDSRKIGIFLGSSIGNFEPHESRKFLKECARHFNPGDMIIIGMDNKKDKAILERAYNDSAGLTAEFNLNLLRRINRALDGNIDINNFTHYAFYNQEKGRIEMRLVCREDATYTVAGREFHFKSGESIHTENSYKYSREDVDALINGTGFKIDQVFRSSDGFFSLYFLMRY